MLLVGLKDPVASEWTIERHPDKSVLIITISGKSKQISECDKLNMRGLRIVRQHNPVSCSNLAHSCVVYSEIAALPAVFNDHFPGVEVIFFTRKSHFTVLTDCWVHFHETHISIGFLEKLKLLRHAADLMLYFFIPCELLEVFGRMYSLKIAVDQLTSLLTAFLCKTFRYDFWIIPTWVFRWEEAAQLQ